jgi:hypothetical protein
MMSLGQGLPPSISLEYVLIENMVVSEKSRSKKKRKRLNVRGICYLGNAEKETETVNAWIKMLSEKKIMADSFGEIKLEEIKRAKFQERDFTYFRVLGE